jgi:hypothetical protein
MWLLVLRAILTIGVLALAAFGAGSWISARLSPTFTKFDRLALSWLAGIGILSLTLFIVGQWRFSRVTAGTVCLIGLLFSSSPLFKLIKEIKIGKGNFKSLKVPALMVLPIVFMIGFSSLAEITGDWTMDAVEYHLLGPKVWIREGVIRPVPDNCHTAMPQTGETLFATAMLFGGLRAPGFWNFTTFLALLLVSASLAKRAGLTTSETWWAVLLIVTMPAVVTGSTHAFVDGLYAAFVLAAARIAFDAVTASDFLVVGLFAGLALGTKYTALLAVPAVLLCVLGRKAFEGKIVMRDVNRILLASFVATVIASPYYLRNWLLLGSPIYPPPPLLWRFFHAKYLTTDTILGFHEYLRQRGKGFGRGIGAFLLLPFNLTYHTSNFFGAGGIGICPLGMSAFGIAASRRNVFAKTTATLGFILLLMWFVTQQESRFLIHGYVLGAIFAVLGWRYAKSGSWRSRTLAGALVTLSVTYGAYMLRYTISDAKTVLSPKAAAAREQQTIPFRESFTFINSDPSVKRVLILDRTIPPYYLDKPYVKPVGPWGERTLPGKPDYAEALNRVREWNVSHILDVQSELAPFIVPRETNGLSLVFEMPTQRVFRVD